MVVGFNDDGNLTYPCSITGFGYTANTGSTWQDRGAISCPVVNGYPGANNGDPIVVSDLQGRFYFGHLARNPYEFQVPGGDGRSFIRVAKSTDNGFTFPYPAVDASPGTPASQDQDKEEMAVDRFSGTSSYVGNIYVCWLNLTTSKILFSRSTDQGQNFSTPIELTGSGSKQGCSISVGRQGYVYVAWDDRTTTPSNIILRRSTTGGGGVSPFDPPVTVGPGTRPPLGTCAGVQRPTLNGNLRSDVFANLAADPSADAPNNVYAVWNSYLTPNGSEIIFRRSTDAGQTWTLPLLILNDVSTNDQYQPRVITNYCAACPATHSLIRVAWYDRRRDGANLAYDVYATYSADGGETWQVNQRLNDTTNPLPLPQLVPTIDCKFSSCSFGDYLGLAAVDPAASNFYAVAFHDTRLTDSGVHCDGSNHPDTSPDPDIRAAVGF